MERSSTSQITARILAVVFAFALWVYVSNEQNPPIEAVFTVPLEVRNVADSLVPVDTSETVKVKIRASRSVIAGIQAKDLKAYVDMSGLDEGQHVVNIHAGIPAASAELVEITPERVQVKLVAMISRKVPVEVKFTGELANGLLVDRFIAEPDKVLLEGRRDVLEAVDKVILPIDITGKNTNFSEEITPFVLGKDGREIKGLTIVPEKVSLSATFSQSQSKKMVTVKPVMYGQLAAGIKVANVTSKPAQVEIVGNLQNLAKIDFVYTDPINITALSADTEKEVKLKLQEGVSTLTKTVTVEINVNAGR
ncbi:MAG: cdaR [Firmicutes bacterium]|nr:cdaR [Bacillota bacterium]